MARIKERKSTGDKTVDEMMARFDHSYDVAFPRFEVMQRLQDAYDNTIDSASWPTISEIGIPFVFNAVEEQLPLAMKYMFPKNRFVNLIPEQVMDLEVVKRVENDLRHTIVNKMSAETSTLPSIKDSYKLGVGYGLVDTMMITPPTVNQKILSKGGKEISRIPHMSLGRKKQVPVYKYVAPGNVIPMPGGANVDGPNRAPGHFVVEMMNEQTLRDLFDEKDTSGKPYFKGDIDALVKEARHMNFDERALNANLIHSLAGYNLYDVNKNDKNIPVIIPVIRCYFDHHQCWIANGTTLIWEAKDKYNTLMSDLVKWSSCPDGTRWFPNNVTEASERLSSGMNIWYNGMIDLAMYMLNPSRVVNADKVDHPNDIARGPNSDIKVRGNPNDVIKYMDLPAFPNALFDMGSVLERFHANTNAQIQSVRQGQAGMVRGGTNALETMLSTSTGRQFLAAIVLKTGGLKPMIEKTLIKKQLLIDKTGEKFIDVDLDADTGERIFVENTVTLEDMRHVFQVELDMPAARLNSAASLAENTAFFDRAERHPELFDLRALYEELTEDYSKVRRVMLPDNVVKERQQRQAEAQLLAQEQAALQGQQPPQRSGGPSVQADQGIAGPPQLGGNV